MPNYRRLRIPGAAYFFTTTTLRRNPILCANGSAELLLSVVEDVRTRLPFTVEVYSILPGHLHMIWTLPEDDADYSRRWALSKLGYLRRFKLQGRSTRGNRAVGSVWQPRFWEHCLRSPGDFAAHVHYIHFNPVKHGLVATPGEWPYPSLRDHVKRGPCPADRAGSDVHLHHVGE